MTILIANIGTSDIAVKVGDYYLPIGFDRSEPNLAEPDVMTDEGAFWRDRRTHLSHFFEQQLHLSPKARFREVTKALLAAYQQSPDVWHDRIVIGRIRGVVHSVLKSHTPLRAHLVTTDQPESEKNGYPTDTVYAFELIKAWLARQEPSLFTGEMPDLDLMNNKVTFSAIHEDRLHDYFYDLFQQFSADETVYLSVKGGTHQMQQALKVQALASNTKAQIFVSPKLAVADILAGEPSDCYRVAYWRYQQNQRYQTVALLLNRWDFEGAAVVLSEWQMTLQALETDDGVALRRQQKTVARVVTGLQVAVAHLNLDLQAAEGLCDGDDSLQSFLQQFNSSENLYAQCKLYAELKHVSHFLSRLGSFYEATQNQLIQALGGLVYINSDKPGYWEVSAAAVQADSPELWQLIRKNFEDKQKKLRESWQLRSRFDKLKYIKGLIKGQYGSLTATQSPSLAGWNRLNFWYGIRNQLVHGAKGINEDRIAQVYQKREAKDKMACAYEEILPTMRSLLSEIASANVSETASGIVQTDSTELQDEHLSGPGYGLYGCIREWAIASLKQQ